MILSAPGQKRKKERKKERKTIRIDFLLLAVPLVELMYLVDVLACQVKTPLVTQVFVAVFV